jgi:hypothetical protein
MSRSTRRHATKHKFGPTKKARVGEGSPLRYIGRGLSVATGTCRARRERSQSCHDLEIPASRCACRLGRTSQHTHNQDRRGRSLGRGLIGRKDAARARQSHAMAAIVGSGGLIVMPSALDVDAWPAPKARPRWPSSDASPFAIGELKSKSAPSPAGKIKSVWETTTPGYTQLLAANATITTSITRSAAI